jgi:outer membrane protein assembly factor BamA
MTRIYKPLFVILAIFASTFAFGQQDRRLKELFGFRTVAVEFVGTQRTDEDWLRDYIGLSFPTTLTPDDAVRIERKLLTTSVFTAAQITFRPTKLDRRSYVMVVDVTEKWTTIPVLRGVYGGGTPLLVAGGYDIHTAGRLWTLGAEARKYGDANPGYVLYFRDPRHAGDRFFLGAEYWQMLRVRDIFDSNGDTIGTLTTNEKRGRVNVLAPFKKKISFGDRSTWKYGLDITWTEEAPATFEANSDDLTAPVDKKLGLPVVKQSYLRTLPTLVFDNVDINNELMDGFRLVGRWGPAFTQDKTHSTAEAQLFYYRLLNQRWNFAGHFFAGTNSSSSLESLYFLGGFDSIRGIPDGIIYGHQASYMNLEMRYLSANWKYLSVQNVLFYDEGLAGDVLAEAWQERRSAIGAGLRLAVPQVHRLMFRLDFAWSVDGSGTRGVSAGLNHFFQPYRPL